MKDIEEVIKQLVETQQVNFERLVQVIKSFGDKAFGGNCGMFAFALGRFLEEHNVKASLVFLSDTDQEDDFFHSDVDLYHVAVILDDDKVLDGSGFTTLQKIVDDIVEPEYDDPSPNVNGYYAIDDNSLRAIRYNTNYDTDWQTFYSKMIKKYEKDDTV